MSVDTPARTLDVARIREDFPILQQQVHEQRLVYLDNANTTQKPRCVIDAVDHYYAEDNANIHRSTHLLSERATRAYEGARAKVQALINAPEAREVVLTRGCTESINLVAQSWGRTNLRPGDEVVLTWMEHHSNIVPWQMLCERTGAVLRVIPIDEDGVLELDEARRLISDRTRIVSIVHVSNALGTINPVAEVCRMAARHGVPVLVDGAQALPHTRVDVQALGCDFYAFSGHKMFGPTGTGVLWGREELLEAMLPWQGGGDMILEVRFDKTTYNELPYKFEAGTPNISGVVGLGAAIDYLQDIGMANIAAYERELHDVMVEKLKTIDGLRLYGEARHKASVQSFLLDDIHSHDIGTILDHQGVAIRTGHHCAMPVMQYYGISGTARASLAFYNNREDIDRLIAALRKAKEMFA